MKQLYRLAAILAILGLAPISESAQRLVTPLQGDHEPLKSDFNGKSSVPRLLVVLAPT